MYLSKHVACSTFFICLVGISGMVLAFQGWNTRTFDFDLIPFIDDAEAFIAHGSIPQKGTLTSFGSYTPPGITWMMMPGALIFRDPRLFELPGCALLYIGTLLGIFLLTRTHFGAATAYLAVALWGFSELGLIFAQSSWARSHPFFYVWMAYWTGKWVEKNNSWYLAAALFTWAVGMYFFLEMAPALLIVPVVWLFYRPLVRPVPVMIVAVLALAVWYPYLRFERGRDFADLKSQVLRQRMWLANFDEFWCNPNLAPESWQISSSAFGSHSPQETSEDGVWRNLVARVRPLWARGNLILDHLVIANFSHAAKLPGVALGLMLVTLAALLVFTIQSFATLNFAFLRLNRARPAVLAFFGITAVLLGVLFNEFTVARFLSAEKILQPSTQVRIRILQGLLITSGLILVFLRETIIVGLRRFIAAIARRDAQPPLRVGIFVISVLVPWVIMLSMTELWRLERFWWLWPLQVVALAAAVTHFPSRLGLSRWSIGLASVITLVLIAGNSLVRERLSAWIVDGWSGRASERIQAIDYIAEQLKLSGNHNPAVGYQPYIYRFMAIYHGIDPRYKVGADFDLLLKYRHGILNRNQCAEGVSSDDEYRVIQTSTDSTDEAAKQRIDLPIDPPFHLVQGFGKYQVFQRGWTG